ncbi:ADP-ribose pyrophosphatase [Arcticibacter svalbardensis MN12-7]|uniref:GDP-mannose pyrophosphatase n=1 Tax=Arcticibacter svalbardensis MN12-7 TaxID=1150600 RepID=R9GM17_9SPHI|nr:NUDIX hydrolase [Arcticibacter svalbardensis]EOR92580.1 ADP-ribose pyrophosphatase [Arcticibacter svalbardensis MN12-7]
MSNLNWEKLSSKYLVKEQWATLRVDTCRMPDGKIVDDYYVLEYPDWVNAVAFTEDGEVLLIRQYRHGAEKVFTEIPGGCIDPGETPEEAVVRELLEETGYAFDTLEPICTVYANPSTSSNRTHSFILTGGKKVQEQDLDGKEEIEVFTVSVAELKELVLQNKIEQALHISSIFFALAKLGKL